MPSVSKRMAVTNCRTGLSLLDSRAERKYWWGMSISELDLVPRGRGRAPAPNTAEYVRELGPSDLALLASERGVKPTAIVRLRDRHHALARCLASGMNLAEASAITGYDISRISVLRGDPQFKELMTHYQGMAEVGLAQFQERALTVAVTALNNLQEMLEDDEAPLPAGAQLEILKVAADRAGHAPVSRSVNVNVNHDLGARMRAAAQRLRNVTPGASDE